MKFINNNAVFWVFFILLSLIVLTYILKKEGVKITITLSPTYDSKEIILLGE